MNLIADVTLLQAVTLISFGIFGAIFGAIGSIIGGSKAKKAAATAASNAAKARAHELKMANLAMAAQEVQSKKTQMLLIAGGGFGLLSLFIFKKKRSGG